ncbi:uncharacterized protein [Asterias amurensis]|uniref:uncharacterized protein n=1 Tax=Asterias amurensis TaxID=7602 RepID=UPI003AB8D5CC
MASNTKVCGVFLILCVLYMYTTSVEGIMLNVLHLPLQKNIEVEEGNNIYLNCQGEGLSSDMSIIWRNSNNETLTTGGRFLVEPEDLVSRGDGSPNKQNALSISSVQGRDRGVYHCLVVQHTSAYEYLVLETMELTVTVYTFPDDTNPECTPGEDTTIFTGDVLSLRCESSLGYPEVNLMITSMNEDVQNELWNTEISTDGRIVRSLNLTASLAHDGVVISCNITSIRYPSRKRSCVFAPISVRQKPVSLMQTLTTRLNSRIHFNPVESTTTDSTDFPTAILPTNSPTNSPTDLPTAILPTDSPTNSPTVLPTTVLPTTILPTNSPTILPTNSPTVSPTNSPTILPTNSPTNSPTTLPNAILATDPPTNSPTVLLSAVLPTNSPAVLPTIILPTDSPTNSPTVLSTTASPTNSPTVFLTAALPTNSPTNLPTVLLTANSPTNSPTVLPAAILPTNSPTVLPTAILPTNSPTVSPTNSPTVLPTTILPRDSPTVLPNAVVSAFLPTNSHAPSPTSLPTIESVTSQDESPVTAASSTTSFLPFHTHQKPSDDDFPWFGATVLFTVMSFIIIVMFIKKSTSRVGVVDHTQHKQPRIIYVSAISPI